MSTITAGCVMAIALTSIVIPASRAAAAPAADGGLHGTPIDPAYVQRFADCDGNDTFDGVHFPIRNAKGAIVWYGCSRDPSKLTRLERSPGTPGWVLFVSKLGHDEDGSEAACHHRGGPTDQCGTSLMLHATVAHPCLPPKNRDGSAAPKDRCVPVDPDTVPYIVIPASAPSGIPRGEFAKKTGVAVGDYGVVLAGGKRVPVIVADTGPAYKIGEGSTALLKMLSADGKPKTFASGVIFIVFPGSRDRTADLSPDDLAATVASKGTAAARKVLPP